MNYIYEIKIGDTEGCSDVDSANIRARNFDEAYNRGKKYICNLTATLHRDELKQEPKDRVPKSYAYTIESITKVCSVDF
jgi:hypothetical protein